MINSKQHGFTLIELLVSVTIFVIIVLIISSAFISALSLQRRAFNFQQVEENTSFLLESIARDIRVSTIVTPLPGPELPLPAPAGCYNSLRFDHPIKGILDYGLSGTNIQKTQGGVSAVLNSSSVRFSRFMFCVSGTANNDFKQSRVTMIAGVENVNANQRVRVDLQTTVSPRYLSN